MNQTTPQPITKNDEQSMLNSIIQFGFKFYGYDENASMLVTAPNGQVVPLPMAFEFVRRRVNEMQVTATNGVEGVPQMPTMPDGEKSPEQNIETNIEKVEEIKQPQQVQPANPAVNQTSNQQTLATPPKMLVKQSIPVPFGDGFVPKFDHSDVEKVMDFINKNTSKGNSSSNKWMAEQWKKFIAEIKEGKIK